MKKTEFEQLPNWMQCAIKELDLKRKTVKITVQTPLIRREEQYFNGEYIPPELKNSGQVIIKIEGWKV